METDIAHNAHHVLGLLSHIMLFFGIAGIVVPLLQRMKTPSVLAYLLCGIVIGPYGLATLTERMPWVSAISIKDASTANLLGELGIVSLMFMIGLELSFNRLRELKRLIFGLGSLQVVCSGLLIFGVALAFGNSLQAAILVGACFALSSTAIVMKLLEEKQLTNQPIGTLCFSVLLMQDLAVVPILVLVSSFGDAAQESIITALLTALAVGVVTVLAIFTLGKRLMTPLLRWVSTSHNPEWLAAFAVFIVIACAALTLAAGLSLALGAFIAGLLIAETDFKHEVEVILAPLKGLLLGIFFLSVGMNINVLEILQRPALLAVSVAGIFFLKALVLFPLCVWFSIPKRQAAKAAIYLSQPGEFALLILGAALSAHIIPAADVQFFLLVTALAMMVTPAVFRLAPAAGRLACGLAGEPKAEQQLPLLNERVVIIAGFGRVGALIGHALAEQQIAYIGIDQNIERVRALKRQGYRVIYGDSRRIELWHRLHSGNVIAAVIAIDDPVATHSILKSIRAEWPLLPVTVRAKDIGDMNVLYDIGAKHVVAETLESSLSAARFVMRQVGTDDATAESIIRKLRERTSE